MKTAIIIQARMGSVRLPGKVLLPLNGHTVISEVISRCRKIQIGATVVCAIPNTMDDGSLELEASRAGAIVIRGPEHDVLNRYYLAAKTVHADVIMRITADCPLLSPSLCAAVLNERERKRADYASNIDPRTFPKGVDCEAFTFVLLAQAETNALDHEREHVTTWMRRVKGVRTANIQSPWPIEGRLTLDTEDDYRVICAAFGHEPYQQPKKAA